ncbi:chromosome partitioning protein ParB [Caballeronia temeraria]|uniref:Chromosome partitioning protein ParB n=1 Tax=Caballeronia temeraria TaxID=1777137 RepID=A0A158B798_9BURK|nr:ParB/Srx family N-terminal domain-containing protein [Caballeronia temeraria]SAK65933.1 chromosome partitioning protein ParB [Caballeronia temeraria]
MNRLRIDHLHPTQVTHGERQIRQKVADYRALNAHELDMAIAAKPIAIVLGPACEPYVIDHHHVACALARIDVQDLPFVLLRDLSSMSRANFWLTLENEAWVYPYDENGRRIAFKDMPVHMWDAVDDAFRSLAAFVRDAGGYEKTDVPLADFRWANFFRAQLPHPVDDTQFDALLERALDLARSDAAAGLPGFLGEQLWPFIADSSR